MDTRVLTADSAHLLEAVQELRSGNPVVVPTETVYGLAAPIDNPQAVQKIYSIKGRPSDNPLIVHITTHAQLDELATQLPEYAKKLFDMFWPGPLTIVAKAKKPLPHVGATTTIAIRMPSHSFMQALITEVGPLAAPSANTSGKPSPTTAEHCLDDLNGRVGLIMDGGVGFHGVESTVLDLSEPQPAILRPGVITQDMIEDVIKQPCVVRHGAGKSPGTKYAHYQPDAQVLLASSPELVNPEGLGNILVVSTHKPTYRCTHIPLPKTAQEIAKQVYGWLRRADAEGFDTIILSTIPDAGIGAAVMDRLRRAAKHS